MTTDQTKAERWDDLLHNTAGSLEVLAQIRDLLAVMAEPKGDPCPCGRRRDVPTTCAAINPATGNICLRLPGHTRYAAEHFGPGEEWWADPEPEPDAVTVTLPRAVVRTPVVGWEGRSRQLRKDGRFDTADLIDALADALEAANGSQP